MVTVERVLNGQVKKVIYLFKRVSEAMRRSRDKKANDPKMGDSLMQQALNLWIKPEIERRRQSGQIPSNFALTAAQIVMNVDAPLEVRLNQEVKIALMFHATKPIAPGEAFVFDDNIQIDGIELTNADPNAGHVTLFKTGQTWQIKFDFRYNANRCSEVLSLANEFLHAAAVSLRRGNVCAFVDNLYSATELIARAELLLIPDKSILGPKAHAVVHDKYNMWGKLGNTDEAHVKLLNRLSNLRKPARYGPKSRLALKPDEPQSMLKTARKMMKRVSSLVPKRITIPPA